MRLLPCSGHKKRKPSEVLQSSRQACAEQIKFENGKFYQAEMTSCGLNGGPLAGKGKYPTYIACNLWGKKGTRFYSMIKLTRNGYPYLTQDGKDRNSGPDQYVANMHDGSVCGFKYFDFKDTKKITLELKGKAEGKIYILNEEKGQPVAEIELKPQKGTYEVSAPLNLKGVNPLYFRYEGKGRFNFYSFTFE